MVVDCKPVFEAVTGAVLPSFKSSYVHVYLYIGLCFVLAFFRPDMTYNVD